MELRNKTIWIISPERWGILKVSKHHYAVALQKLGNAVYFLEPPVLEGNLKGTITKNSDAVNILSYKPLARGKRFIGRKIFTLLQKWQFRNIIKSRKNQPDIVWCFDDGNFDDLRIFGAAINIFHPVDHNLGREQPACASTADMVLSTTPAILAYMKPGDKPGFVIGHGLNEDFEKYAIAKKADIANHSTVKPFNNKVGFWGSLFKESLDRKRILQLVEQFPGINFTFIGPCNLKDANLGGRTDKEAFDFLESLKLQPNVKLLGPLNGNELTKVITDIELYLNIEFEYSRRWDNGNPHKILEYLATGMPVLSTPVLMYNHTNLLFFVNDENVIESFNNLIRNWDKLNAKQEQIKRIDFALNNTYLAQILRIEKLCDDNLQTL
jgi:glycosyltransferase involved in cell wall biosynthesis